MRPPETRDIVILAIKIVTVTAILAGVMWIQDVMNDLEELGRIVNEPLPGE